MKKKWEQEMRGTSSQKVRESNIKTALRVDGWLVCRVLVTTSEELISPHCPQ